MHTLPKDLRRHSEGRAYETQSIKLLRVKFFRIMMKMWVLNYELSIAAREIKNLSNFTEKHRGLRTMRKPPCPPQGQGC